MKKISLITSILLFSPTIYGEPETSFETSLVGPPTMKEIIKAQGARHKNQRKVDDCADCHTELVESFRQTHMSRALSRPLLSEVVENFAPELSSVIHPKTGVGYRAYIDDSGRWWQEEFDPHGEYKYRLEVKYLIGSGHNTRSYLGEVNGELVELPLTWYSATDKRPGLWDMSPGYQRKDHFRFSRPVKGDCLFCHNDLTPIDDNKLSGFTEELATGITCVRCHGDGESHIEYRLNGEEPIDGEPDLTILNPAHLSQERQEHICEQCHLSGEARALLPNQRWDQYDPNTPLNEYMDIFAFRLDSNVHKDTDGTNSFGIASHAERLALSRCSVMSRTIGCTTCHNPHAPDTPQSYQQACSSCHKGKERHDMSKLKTIREDSSTAPLCTDGKHEPEQTCFSCHMKKSGTSDIPHVRMTDHWIRTRIGVAQSEELIHDHEVVYSDKLTSLLATSKSEDQQNRDGLLGLAYADLVRYNGRSEFASRALLLLVSAVKANPDWKELWSALGELSDLLGDKVAAVSAYQKYRALKPYDEYFGLKEVKALIEIGDEVQAESILTQMIDHSPDRYQAIEALANLKMKQKLFSEAEKFYLRADQLNPSSHSIAHNLGLLYFVQGQINKAKNQFIEGSKRDGVSSEGPFYLALVEAAQKNYPTAIKLMRESVKRNPDHVVAYQQLARILFESGDREGCLVPLRAWIKERPESTDAYFTLAMYLDTLGKYQEVYNLLKEASKRIQDPRLKQALEISKNRLNRFNDK